MVAFGGTRGGAAGNEAHMKGGFATAGVPRGFLPPPGVEGTTASPFTRAAHPPLTSAPAVLPPSGPGPQAPPPSFGRKTPPGVAARASRFCTWSMSPPFPQKWRGSYSPQLQKIWGPPLPPPFVTNLGWERSKKGKKERWRGRKKMG